MGSGDLLLSATGIICEDLNRLLTLWFESVCERFKKVRYPTTTSPRGLAVPLSSKLGRCNEGVT